MFGRAIYYTVLIIAAGAFLVIFGPVIMLSIGIGGRSDMEDATPLNNDDPIAEEVSIATPVWALRPSCEINSRPPNARIHAVTLYKGGIETPAQAFGTPARQVNVIVTDKGGPVFLLLSARNAVIWNIRTAPKVVLGGIVTTGFDRQTVVTRGARVPMLAAAVADKQCSNVFRRGMNMGMLDAVSADEIAQMSTQAFGRVPDNLVDKHSLESIVLGPEEDAAQLPAEAEPFVVPDFLVDQHRPILFGRPALARLVSEGILAPATEADLASWRAAGPLSPNLPSYIVNLDLARTYVIKRPFRLPLGLVGEASAAFIQPAGMKQPDGWVGENAFLKYSPFGCAAARIWNGNCDKKDFGDFESVGTTFKSQ